MSASQDRPLAGIVLIVAGVAILCVQDMLQKLLVDAMHMTTLLVLRSAFLLALVVPVLALRQDWRSLLPANWRIQAIRIGSWVGCCYAFLEALRHLPLADAAALGMTSTLFMTALSVPLLGERVGVRRWSAVAVGFVGVLIVTRPGFAAINIGAFYTLLAAITYALTMILARRVAATNSDAALVLTLHAGLVVVCTPVMLLEWETPSAQTLAGIAAMALTVAVGQMIVQRAFRIAPVAVVAPFNYTALLWSALLGWLVWGDRPEWNVWAGGALIIAAGLYIVRREQALARGG
jgi:drug/metabolite transporter (DMT)-like permease